MAKTILLKTEETKHIISSKLKINKIGKSYIHKIMDEYLLNDLAILILNHIKTEECYTFNDEYASHIKEEDLDCSKLIIHEGEFNPLNYDSIGDFLNTSTAKCAIYRDYGRLQYDIITIGPKIIDKLLQLYDEKFDRISRKVMREGKDTITANLYIEEKNNVVIAETRQNIKTSQITTKKQVTVEYSDINEIPDKCIKTDTVQVLAEHEILIVDSDYIYRYLIDGRSEISFKDIYMRGCRLLKHRNTFYRAIKYTGTPIEKLLYRTIKTSVKTNSIIRADSFATGGCDKFTLSKFSISNDKATINRTVKCLADKISRRDCRNGLDNHIKLLASIYAYQNNKYTIENIKEMFKYSYIRNSIINYEIEDSMTIMYPMCKVQEEIKNKLPSEIKDYYTIARNISRKFILHIGPTNSGKTYESLEKFKQAESGVYLAPLRLLALEVQEKMIQDKLACSLLTGEEEDLIDNARHICCTIEKLNFNSVYDIAIIDEGQMLEDRQRGSAWTSAILGVCAKEVHICAAEHAKDIIIELIKYCNEPYEIIEHSRETELIVSSEPFDFLKDTQEGDAIVVFSKRKVINIAAAINTKTNMTCSVLFGALPYRSRKRQFKNFAEGRSKVLVTTDAIGLGVNLAIKRIIFMEESKFSGYTTLKLKTSEVLQIAGRAGRKNIYDKGYVTLANERMLKTYNETIEPLSTIYVGLTQHLVEIDSNLKDTIAAWAKIEFKAPFIKANISNQLNILESIEEIEITKQDRYKALFMPVNTKSYYEMNLFTSYLEELSEKGTQIEFPELPPLKYNDKLKQLEDYSKAIDIYYSFCKVFKMDLDTKKVEHERETTSIKINNLLLSNKLEVSTCNSCGQELAWDNYRYKCQNCYSSRDYEDHDL